MRQRAKRLLLTGLMVCAMAASLVPAQAATIKEASVTWKEVSQDINDKDQYVYDTDKTDATMPSLVLSKSSIGVLGYIDRGIVQKNTGSLLVKLGGLVAYEGRLETGHRWSDPVG